MSGEVLRAYKLSNALLTDKNNDLEYKNEQILHDVSEQLRLNNEQHETQTTTLKSEFDKNILELDKQIISLEKKIKELQLKSNYWECKYRKESSSRIYNYFFPNDKLKEEDEGL